MKREKLLLALDGGRGHQFLSARVIVDMPVSSVEGFTMLELLITIVILCVLLGLAIPGFSNWVPNYRLRGAVRDIYSNFQYAKMTAVKDRKRCGVLFSVGTSYRVVSFAPGADGVYGTVDDPSPSHLKTVEFSEYGSGIAYGHGSATGGVGGAGFDNEVTFEEDGIVFDWYRSHRARQKTGLCARNGRQEDGS